MIRGGKRHYIASFSRASQDSALESAHISYGIDPVPVVPILRTPRELPARGLFATFANPARQNAGVTLSPPARQSTGLLATLPARPPERGASGWPLCQPARQSAVCLEKISPWSLPWSVECQ